jgi:UPF0716 family protein affecting phage T7 exclusion
MTEGLSIRLAILLLTVAQACIAALLGFAEILPQEWKVALVVLAAGVGVALNQVPSWMNAGSAERALRAKDVD